VRGIQKVQARGLIMQRCSNHSRVFGYEEDSRVNHARETKSTVGMHTTSSNASSSSASTTNVDSNSSDDSGGGDGSEDGGGGDDDDPADIILPIVYQFVFPSNFLSSLLLVGTAWLFKDSFFAAIPLIGLCALCAFRDKLWFLKGEMSSQGAKFEIRSKK